MSYIRLNIIDHDRTVSGEVHGGLGDRVIASLSAEPESIHELELALTRFQKPTGDWSAVASLREGKNFEPYDAGIMIVDLAGQVVMIDSTYSVPAWVNQPHVSKDVDFSSAQSSFKRSEQGGAAIEVAVRENELRDVSLDHDAPTTFEIRYHDGEQLTDVRLPYRLPDTWMFVGSVPEYKGLYLERQTERARTIAETRDARAVLFGRQLSAFVAREMLSATNPAAPDLFAKIHAKWLVSSRADLGGRSPREVLLARREFIDFDLFSRELQWSITGECPAALLPSAFAYRFAGFGTHEIVIYYDLIRRLLDESYQRVCGGEAGSVEHEAEWLEQIKGEWLEAPDPDNHGKSPALLIDWERRRIPLVLSEKELIIDEDCPVCLAMAEDHETPTFWHLDGCNMDDQFEFSFCLTREEWEAERRRREEFDREFDRKWQGGEVVKLPDSYASADKAEPF